MPSLSTWKVSLIVLSCLLFIFASVRPVSAQTTISYTYDFLGRLVVTRSGANVAKNFFYDDSGNRIDVTISGASEPGLLQYGGVLTAPQSSGFRTITIPPRCGSVNGCSAN